MCCKQHLKKWLACPDHGLIILCFSIFMSAFLFVPSLVKRFGRRRQAFCTATCTSRPCSTPRICGWCYSNNREIASSRFECTVSHAVWRQHLSQMSSAGFFSCSTPACFFSSACSPFQPSSLLCFHLSPVFYLPLEFFSICLSTTQPPCSHHSRATESPACLSPIPRCPVLLRLPAAFLLPWVLLPPPSVFPVIIHTTCSLFISWNTGTSLTDGNKNIWKEDWGIRQGPLLVSSSMLPLAPAVPDKSIKIPWAALGFKLPQQEHSTVIPNSYRSFCVLRQEVLCVCIKTLSFKTWISHYHTQMWEIKQDLLLFQIMT